MEAQLSELLSEAKCAVEASFLGRERSYLRHLRAIRIEQGVLQVELDASRLSAGSELPNPSQVLRMERALTREVQRRLGEAASVRIRASSRGVSDRLASPGRSPLVDEGNRTAYLLLDGLISGTVPGMHLVYLFGAAGVGKTFLIDWFTSKTGTPPTRFDALEYHEAYRRALRSRTLESFHRSLGRSKFLIVDEVHRLRGKRKTQAELAHLIDEIKTRQGMALFLGRHHPRQILEIHSSLSSRFLGGFTVEIGAPRLETRRNFLRSLGLSLPELGGDVTTKEDARRVLEERLLRGSKSYGDILQRIEGIRASGGTHAEAPEAIVPPSAASKYREENLLSELAERVGRLFGLEGDEIYERSSVRRAALPRQVLAFLAREKGISGAELSRRLGWKSSSSVSYAARKIRRRMELDPDFRRVVDSCL